MKFPPGAKEKFIRDGAKLDQEWAKALDFFRDRKDAAATLASLCNDSNAAVAAREDRDFLLSILDDPFRCMVICRFANMGIREAMRRQSQKVIDREEGHA